MPPSVTHREPARKAFSRGFGHPAADAGDRWPMPVAAAAILAMSATAWALLIQAGRFAAGLFG